VAEQIQNAAPSTTVDFSVDPEIFMKAPLFTPIQVGKSKIVPAKQYSVK
jgi:hypothetical protein